MMADKLLNLKIAAEIGQSNALSLDIPVTEVCTTHSKETNFD